MEKSEEWVWDLGLQLTSGSRGVSSISAVEASTGSSWRRQPTAVASAVTQYRTHPRTNIGDALEVQLVTKPWHAQQVDLSLQPQTVLEVVCSHVGSAEHLFL